jgi:DNA-binding IclR family transcriptional regulator
MARMREGKTENRPKVTGKATKVRETQRDDEDSRTPIDDGRKYFSRAVAKAFQMLDLLRARNEPSTLKEIEHSTALTKSSAFRLLQTLEQLNYICQRTDGRYEISNRYRVNSGIQLRDTLLHSEIPAMRALHEEFQETVSIAVLFTNHIEVVCVIEAHHPVRMANTVGRILSPHASSLGKAITAFQSEEVRHRLVRSYGLVRFTPATITDEIQLRSELNKICKDRFSLENEESTPEGYCFGAPIFQGGAAAVGAISISLPKSRVPVGKLRARMIDALRETASAISAELASANSAAVRATSMKS